MLYKKDDAYRVEKIIKWKNVKDKKMVLVKCKYNSWVEL